MSYREELDAALERVRVLERTIIELSSGHQDLQIVTAERDRLLATVARLQSQAEALRAVAAPPRPGLLTVDEHNRRLPPQTRGWDQHRAGVLCPRCRAAGADVELVLGPNQWKDRGTGDVRCPVWMKLPS